MQARSPICALVVSFAFVAISHADPVPTPVAPMADPTESPLPINLPTALHLAGVNPIDISLASQRIQIANAQLERANLLWLPTVYIGTNYARHDGQIQDIEGRVFTTSRSSFLIGGGPNLTFAVTDAIYAPLAARQIVLAREFDAQATRNDVMLMIAEAYFSVQQSRGELAGANDVVRRTEDVVNKAEKLAPGLIPQVETSRSRIELARRRQSVEVARDRWQSTSAELARLLRLNPSSVVEPAELPQMRVELIDTNTPVDDLIPVGLTYRPELAAHQAIVRATLARLKQEKMRPLIPSILIRGNATNPSGTISSGLFGGGRNDNVTNFGGRNSMDVQVLWEIQNLGLGNRAIVREREAESQLATLELFRLQDRIAAEVVAAHSQAKRAFVRAQQAELALRESVDATNRIVQAMGQTKRVGESQTLIFRPLEVVAMIQTLAQTYDDYYRAIADANRGQFRLYRALGHPAHGLTQIQPVTEPPK